MTNVRAQERDGWPLQEQVNKYRYCKYVYKQIFFQFGTVAKCKS